MRLFGPHLLTNLRLTIFLTLLASLFFGGPSPWCGSVLLTIWATWCPQAHSIAWTIHSLLDNPEVEARLLAELDGALPPLGTPLTAAHLAAMPYADAVIKESLRAFPPAPLGTIRKLQDDIRLPSDGSLIPAGTVVQLPIFPIHRKPLAYPAPDVFDPAGWLPPNAPGGGGYSPAALRTARSHFLPFSTGPRACPGRNMAAVEAKSVLAVFLHRFQWRRVGAAAGVVLENTVTLRPAGLRVTLHRREA